MPIVQYPEAPDKQLNIRIHIPPVQGHPEGFLEQYKDLRTHDLGRVWRDGR